VLLSSSVLPVPCTVCFAAVAGTVTLRHRSVGAHDCPASDIQFGKATARRLYGSDGTVAV
jgi:predicted transporter